MNTVRAVQAKSAFMFVLVVSVVLGALGEIVKVLEGSTELLTQFNYTCLLGAAAGACGLACASLAVRGRRALPLVGIVLVVAAAALQTFAVWTEELPDQYGQIAWCVSIFAVAFGHLAAL